MGKFYNLLENIINRINASVKSVNGVSADDNGDVRVNHPTNLLDNSDFTNPVNQRELVGYIDAAGYFLDRWMLVEGNVNVGDNGITLNGTICQILERIPSGPVTAFASSGVASFDESTNTFNLTASGELITWAALYEGGYSERTRPSYISKGYSAELIECYRYYWRSVGYLTVFGYSVNATTAYLFANLPVKMRIDPTITITGATITIRCNDGKTHSGATLSGSSTMIGNLVRFGVTDSSLGLTAQNMVIGTVSDTAGILEISADL